MFPRCGIFAAIFFLCLPKSADFARILAIGPRASISHQVVMRGLTLAMNKRGHEIVAVTSDPVNDLNLKNYTEIDVSFLYHSNSNSSEYRGDWLKYFWKMSNSLNLQTKQILEHPEFEQIYASKSDEKFDLILLEFVYWPGLLALSKRFDAPVIGWSSMGLSVNIQYAVGNPILTSHPSHWDLYMSSELSFYQRIEKWINTWNFLYYYQATYVPQQQAIAREYFGDDIPDIRELEKNVSLLFVNQQPAISHCRPNVPNIITIGGFHVSKQIEPLPEELNRFLDEANAGFVYMSLGSNMKSTMLSNDTRNEIMAAFSKLPFKVLWKFEDEVLPGKPDNVRIMKWIPQQEVLAHPNLKVFIYQGGLQSTEEAVVNAVPLIGLPTWADQRVQVDKMVSLGVAKRLSIPSINEIDLKKAILEVAFDKKYKENMIHLRELLIDHSHDLLENAIWWMEHVILNKGASYLRSSTADDPWYRRNDMDIIAFISSMSTVVIALVLLILRRLITRGINAYNMPSAEEKKKLL